MLNAATRGQRAALAAVADMVRGDPPHAILVTGPASSGKTTLALDLAAGLLCRDPDPAARPCRHCRGCHLVASGNHPDLHRLSPEGPGGQVRIGSATAPEPGTVRHLISELALLPAEGGARVAIVEQAHRINDDAQNALLKLLEEPPSGVTLILCADDEECLLPTVRSRCVRIRLGSVPTREIEAWLGELGLADAPAAARYARLAGGSPGLALAYARAPEAARLRAEISRGLLDMLSASRQQRLTSVRLLMSSAAGLVSVLAQARDRAPGEEAETPARRPRRSKPEAEAGVDATTTASDRRAAAATLVAVWSSLARDLAVAGLGARRQVRELELLDELSSLAPSIDTDVLSGFLARLAETAARLDENVNPELALDVLALAWPSIPAVPGSGG